MVSIGNRRPGRTTSTLQQKRRKLDPKIIDLGTSIGTQDLRGTPKDTNTSPEKITREIEEERGIT